jgi:hypothetical protein
LSHHHTYGFFHAHRHEHHAPPDGSPPITWEHEHGHCHFEATTHDHGPATRVHSHKKRGFHPGEDKPPGGYKEHHGKDMAVWEVNVGTSD